MYFFYTLHNTFDKFGVVWALKMMNHRKNHTKSMLIYEKSNVTGFFKPNFQPDQKPLIFSLIFEVPKFL